MSTGEYQPTTALDLSYNSSSNSGAFGSGATADYSGQGSGGGSTSFMPTSPKSKHDDLKSMLESTKDGLKLEAMKRLIVMIAKGRSSSDTSARELFPHVVKNVVTKNAELKKLVYLYLARYAEQEQDLALLSVSSFQRSLKDPNPLIRASALRILTSIRVPMIAPIMLISIRDSSNDMSPYVRKTAAHAIPKLYFLDPELRSEAIDIIERLLNDKTSLVLGSAVAAFEEICPERLDLIHQNYRKFVSLMTDFDEWGQVLLINMLIRYARTQFCDPNGDKYANSESEVTGLVVLDPDHRMLLRNAKPLLQSRNAAVVLAVIQLYLYLAPMSEVNTLIVKPLIRLLHSRREIQGVILANVATLTSANETSEADSKHVVENDCESDNESKSVGLTNGKASCGSRITVKGIFDPYLKSFFVKSRDSTQIKILKLEILTNLSNSSNIPLILREFQAYIHNYQDEDMDFVAATIQSIGRCASRIKEIGAICLNGLISLLSNRNETIVSQSIIVIRTQIINKNESNDKDSIVSMIIKQVTKLMTKITTPNARATILWILAEFCDKNGKALKIGPDVLRLTAKSFCSEADLVKLQALNLASKLFLTMFDQDSKMVCELSHGEKERFKTLVDYIFTLAKYDLNYDVRDRGRFLRQLLLNAETSRGMIVAKRILLSPKEEPKTSAMKSKLMMTNYNGQCNKFRIGTLCHYLGKSVSGYKELPDFPEVAPDPSVRVRPDDEVPAQDTVSQFELIRKEHYAKKGRKTSEKSKFYDSSDDDEKSDDEDDDDDEDEEEDDEDDDETSEEESEEEEGSNIDESETNSEEDNEEEESEDDNSEEESEENSSSDEPQIVQRRSKQIAAKSRKKEQKPTVDLLINFDE